MSTKYKLRIALVAFLFIYIPLSIVLKTDIYICSEVTIFAIIIMSFLMDAKNNIVIIGFLICFFVFLMAGPVAQEYFNAVEKRTYTEDAVVHSHICIIVSLLTIYFSHLMLSHVRIGRGSYTYDKDAFEDDRPHYRIASKYAYWFTYFFKVLYIAHLALFVTSNSYMAFYTSYTKSGFWSIAEKLGDMSLVAISMFFATLPSKEESKPILVSYLLYAFLSLFTGRRFEAVFICMFVIVVYTYRGWIKRKHVAFILISIPFVMAGLQMVEILRAGHARTLSTSGNIIVDFMNFVGGSNKVIRYGYMYQDSIPDYKFYSFGNVIEYFKYNPISRYLFNLKTDRMTRVFEGNSFSTIITYLWNSTLFNAGNGLGSCYIAELYNDFGYLGIALGNFFLVFILKKVVNLNSSSYIKRYLGLLILSPLFLTPRGNYSDALLYMINIYYWIMYWAIASVAHRFAQTAPHEISSEESQGGI